VDANKHKKALKITEERSPSEICKVFSYYITLPSATNLIEANRLKVCARNPHSFRERLSKRQCNRERETEKESAPHMDFIPNYFLKHLEVTENSVTFRDVNHECWKNMMLIGIN